MKRTAVIPILILMLTFTAAAQDDLFDAANGEYRNGNYTEALAIYSDLADRETSSALYYNMGNTYYKMGDFARAILNYERALRMSPGDDDIRHNLGIANLNVTDKINATPEFFLLTWWKSLSLKAAADSWTILFLITLWAGVLSFLAFAYLTSTARKFLFIPGMAGILAAVVFLLLAVTRHQFDTDRSHAIVLSPSASVKSAPLHSGKDLFIIHEGLKIDIIDEESGWLEIRLADGKQGWIPAQMVETI